MVCIECIQEIGRPFDNVPIILIDCVLKIPAFNPDCFCTSSSVPVSLRANFTELLIRLLISARTKKPLCLFGSQPFWVRCTNISQHILYLCTRAVLFWSKFVKNSTSRRHQASATADSCRLYQFVSRSYWCCQPQRRRWRFLAFFRSIFWSSAPIFWTFRATIPNAT